LTDNSGFVAADIWTLETSIPGVYAVGDVASLKLPNGNPHPKAGVFAENQASAVARNIISAIKGTEPVKYSGTGVCFIDAGRGQASQARAELLTQEGPKFVFAPPSDEGLKSKRSFETEHFKKWFGS
jgi:NADH dehydrogenase FAD-containing subunit